MNRKLIKLINTSRMGFPYDKAMRFVPSSAALAKIGPVNRVNAPVAMLFSDCVCAKFACSCFRTTGLRGNALPIARIPTSSAMSMLVIYFVIPIMGSQ